MDPRDLFRLLRAQPFGPFRIHLDDGTRHTVNAPAHAFVSADEVIVTSAHNDETGVPRRSAHFHPLRVARVEQLPATSTAFCYTPAMAPQDILKKLRAKPFKSFRIYLSDGKTYDVTEETHTYMTPTELTIGIEHDDNGLPFRSAYISPNHVVRVEPLATTATG